MPADPQSIQTLRARVEAATGADRRLDLDVARALGQHWACTDNPPDQFGDDWWPSDIVCAAVSSSIDAALALVAQKMPGARVEMKWEPDSYSAAEILTGRNHSTRHLGGYERADSELPLAIISALLSALDKDQPHE